MKTISFLTERRTPSKKIENSLHKMDSSIFFLHILSYRGRKWMKKMFLSLFMVFGLMLLFAGLASAETTTVTDATYAPLE